MATPKKGGLGRGLDALFADSVSIEPEKEEKVSSNKETAKKEAPVDDKDKVLYLSIHDIKPNKNQPRKTFNEEKIAELADSILEHGIIQPIVVRKKDKGFEIVAGERRYRAAIKANLQEVPCLVRELSDDENMLLAIIENMQREDLNPIEEAEGLNQMVTTFKMTQEEVSKSLGKSRPYITNALRLLKLPEYIKEAMAKGEISQAHGRTLLSVENAELQKKYLQKIIEEGLSVRQTEELCASKGKAKKKAVAKKINPDLAKVEEELKAALGTRVTINQAGKKGKIEIEYFSKDELERLIDLLKTLG